MLPLPFHSYRLRSKKAAQTRLLNCYAIQAPPEGRAPITVQGIAGITSFATIAAGPQKAAIEFNGGLLCVSGNTLYQVSSAGVSTSLGAVSGGAVDIGKIVGQVAILAAPNLYVWDGSTLTQVTDSDFTSRGASKMAILDNYGGFIEPDSGRFFICDLADFTVYDALDFATAESQPDNLLSIEASQTQFALFGAETIELWDNVGGSGFPFLRIPNGVIQNGCGAADSTCAIDNTFFWLDQDRLARKLEGITPRRISKDGCEEKWQDYATVSDAVGFGYVHDGRTCYVLRFPSAGATWVYDLNTQEWHERESYGFDHWRAAWILKCFDKTLVGDTESGNIGQIDSNTYTEWDNELLREATSGVIYDERKDLTHDRLELDMEVGRAQLGDDPHVMLDLSDDGGVTFRSVPSRSLGYTGNYTKTVDWHRLGRTPERVYRFRCTDNVPFTIMAGRLDLR